MHLAADSLCAASRVLLVDDDPSMLRLLSAWLKRGGYEVETASNGREALAAVEQHCPDFLITDWEMPEINGLELCQRVRQLPLPHYVYILFLTVRSAPEEAVAGLETGADEFLAKPVDRAELLARMRAGSRVLALERQLSAMANTDSLTGLTTRRVFLQAMEKEWGRVQRHHVPLSCVMMDIDFFKRINDLHGHPAGDAVLKSVAEIFRQECRESDLACRFGGEEFCVMLPETDADGAARWAERVRQRIGENPFLVGGKNLHVTGSFGTAQNHDDTQSCEQLIDQADQALLCAKRSGRDRVVRFESLTDSGELALDDGGKCSLFDGVVARHVMTPLVVCLQETETVGQAAEFFLRSRINSTPVVDAEGLMTGILSEKDLMAAMVSLDCWNRPISEVMKPNVICYEEETPIRVIYEFLCRVSIRRVVIAEQGRPTGTISRGTLLRWFRNLVLGKGLLDESQPVDEANEADPFRSKQRLAETSRELAEVVTTLQRQLDADDDGLMANVVGGATRMQELVDDLLAYSRYASAGAGSLQSLLMNSCNLE